MADLKDYDFSNFLERLQGGEKIICPKCGKGIIEPYNPFNSTDYKKIYNFFCPCCDFTSHGDPVIDIE